MLKGSLRFLFDLGFWDENHGGSGLFQNCWSVELFGEASFNGMGMLGGVGTGLSMLSDCFTNASAFSSTELAPMFESEEQQGGFELISKPTRMLSM